LKESDEGQKDCGERARRRRKKLAIQTDNLKRKLSMEYGK
jgi:hypothetical protein